MKRGYIWGIVIVVAVLGGFFALNTAQANPEALATCLTERGAKMYGAYWCPHCIDQKKDFGAAWDKVDYIECSLPNAAGQTEFCKQQKITGYPTWEFADGTRMSGKVPLDQLAQKTGCPVN